MDFLIGSVSILPLICPLISLISFQLLEEEDVEVPVVKESSKEATKMDTDETPAEAIPSASEADVHMQDAKGATNVPGSDNGFQEGDKPAHMETDAKVSINIALIAHMQIYKLKWVFMVFCYVISDILVVILSVLLLQRFVHLILILACYV